MVHTVYLSLLKETAKSLNCGAYLVTTNGLEIICPSEEMMRSPKTVKCNGWTINSKREYPKYSFKTVGVGLDLKVCLSNDIAFALRCLRIVNYGDTINFLYLNGHSPSIVTSIKY